MLMNLVCTEDVVEFKYLKYILKGTVVTSWCQNCFWKLINGRFYMCTVSKYIFIACNVVENHRIWGENSENIDVKLMHSVSENMAKIPKVALAAQWAHCHNTLFISQKRQVWYIKMWVCTMWSFVISLHLFSAVELFDVLDIISAVQFLSFIH